MGAFTWAFTGALRLVTRAWLLEAYVSTADTFANGNRPWAQSSFGTPHPMIRIDRSVLDISAFA
jgi:hypothetical protein